MELIHLKSLLNKRGESARLSKATNISTGNISDWLNPSKKSTPNAEALCKIASYFNCSVDYLLDRTNIKSMNIQNIYRFPVYDQQAAAGAGMIGRDGDFEIEDIITDYIPDNAVFGIHIKGKSMEDTIPDDSVVLLDTKFDPYELDGQNVIAEINGDVICKQYNQQSDHIWFKSLNREFSHEDRYIYDNNYRIIGKIVKIIL
ncbi:XRE family transcriptional regulator [Agathobacter rectalis]|jgi:phage repressor protein C with HTH and peptisase S24 domain|uniref:XRE family transcriptional regulator n=1 Tax=Agathobacter rectalis TaxID=39491 RepID=UPI00321A4218